MLKADVWRDQLIREESILNARLAELEQQGDDKRFEDAKEEASSRLAEVHASLSEMDAASGPARAASLLAGTSLSLHATYPMLMVRKGLGFSEEDQHRPTKSFSGGWRYVASLFVAFFYFKVL